MAVQLPQLNWEKKPAKNEKGIGKFTNSDGSDRGNVLKRKEHTNVMKKEMAK